MKYNIGVEIGVKLIQAAIVDKYGRLIARAKTPSLLDRQLPEIIESAANLIKELLEDQDLDVKNVKSIGVASPGDPDEEGTKIMMSYITGFYNAPIRDEFKKHFKQPIYVENDAHCAALAESIAGAAEDLDYSVTINLGVGISGGIIIKDEIYAGLNGAGAVMGHMVIDKNGKKCYCGRNGCFETVCSAKAIVEQTKELAQKNTESKIWEICKNDVSLIDETTAYKAMMKGDEEAKKIFDEYVDNLAIALINYANILMPEVIILCGGITDLGENLLRPVREKMKAGIFSRETTVPMLKLSEMGTASALVGAGMLGAYRKR